MEPQAALRPLDKLQLLADALALEFSQSLASAQCSQALHALLPGLEYLRCEEACADTSSTQPSRPLALTPCACLCARELPVCAHLPLTVLPYASLQHLREQPGAGRSHCCLGQLRDG